MEYLVVFQLLCGCFSAFVAGRKGRSRFAWWLVGALVPVFGVLLSLMVAEAPAASALERAGKRGRQIARKTAARPKRCQGSYMADCQGCPYFRRQLFDPEGSAGKKGSCEFFGEDLVDEPGRENSRVIIDDG